MIQDFRDDLLANKRGKGPTMPVLGHLRSGIMRLVRPKQDASTVEQKAYEDRVVKYRELVIQGLAWDEIGEKIGGKKFLTPENQDYFTCRAVDCRTNPENAAILHNLYADKDGNIRRVPIVFLSNDWFECIPHQLECRTQTKWLYRSEYVKGRDDVTGELGYIRVCVKPIPYEKGKRPFQGQDTEERGPCRPAECKEYQRGECKLSGYIQGVIPGTRGAGVWQIHTKSIYSFMQMMEKLKLVQQATGRIIGLIDQQTRKPIFTIMKVADAEVSRFIVETGATVKTEQDLIHLEADIDMFELMLAFQPQAILGRAEQARAITGPAPPTPGDVCRVPDKELSGGITQSGPKTYILRHEPDTENVLRGSPEGPAAATPDEPSEDVAKEWQPEVEQVDLEAVRRSCMERCVGLFSKMTTEGKKLYKQEFPVEIIRMDREETQKAEMWLLEALKHYAAG